MAKPSNISMLVCYQSQKRKIVITTDANLNMIEYTICNMFNLVQLHQYQVQFYDTEFQEYIDLYPETWNEFVQLFHTLSTPPSLPKSKPEWRLLVVCKMVDITQANNTESASITNGMRQGAPVEDDIEYDISQVQGDLDITNIFDSNNDLISLTNSEQELCPDLNEIGNNTTRNVSPPSVINNSENTASQRESDIEHEQEGLIPTPDPVENRSVEGPLYQNYNLRFDPDLADSQRLQTESEAVKQGVHGSSIGGCLLLAPGQESEQEDGKIHPTVHFNIGANMYHLSWTLHFLVLTEADRNGNHYIHPSKEILNEDRIRKLTDTNDLQTSPSDNSNSTTFVKRQEVTLSSNDLEQGTHEIRIRVFNRGRLSIRKKDALTPFDQIDPTTGSHILVLGNAQQSSGVSLSALGLSHKNYCLATLLLQGNEIVDGCISKMTTEEDRATNKRKHDDETVQ